MRNRRTTSLDFRERILGTYDAGEGTREDVARRFRVSLGMVKKLLAQRRHTGDIAPRHHLAGRKPEIVAHHEHAMRAMLGGKPDLTLKELREALGLECSLQAIHVVLGKMGLTSGVSGSRITAALGNRGGFFVRPRWNLLSLPPHRGRSERERTPGSEGFAFGLQPYLILSARLALLVRIFKCIQQMNNAESSPECAKSANTACAGGIKAP